VRVTVISFSLVALALVMNRVLFEKIEHACSNATATSYSMQQRRENKILGLFII